MEAMQIEQALKLALEQQRAGRVAEAEATLRRVLHVEPDNVLAMRHLGFIASEAGNYTVSAGFLERAALLQPQNADLLHDLGTVLLRLGRLHSAEISFRNAIALKPDLVATHNNLGYMLEGLGRLQDAEQCYRHALAREPNYAEAHNNLANTLKAQGRLQEAEQHLRRALTIKPHYVDAQYNLGIVLQALNRLDEAVASYRQALEFEPNYVRAHYNLGIALQGLGRLQEAEKSYCQARALKPDYAEARCMCLFLRQSLCAWADLAQDASAIRQLVSNGEGKMIFPFTFLALPDTHAEEQYQCARQCAESAFQSSLGRPPLFEASSKERPRLRIGYLSADFHEHATSNLIAEVIERHNRGRVEVYAYSYGRDDRSSMRRRMQTAFDFFHDIATISDDAAARMILSHGIDILVDLKGFTANARLNITALRPAPLQVSWLGYPGTLGHPRLADYLIGDPVVTPLEHAQYYSETLALMPHCYQPNDRQRKVGNRPMRAEVGLPEDGIVFCCFNQSYKITPTMFGLWCRVLAAVPGSVLWLLRATATAQENLKREATLRGISADRIVFAPVRPLSVHLGRLQLADLALDTFPYTSHTTGSDALWAGVPIVTLVGETFISRVAASILHAAHLPELVTYTADSYYRLAVELASTPQRLNEVRARLEANRLTCPLFDSERFARTLERLFERMWRDHCANKKEAFLIED